MILFPVGMFEERKEMFMNKCHSLSCAMYPECEWLYRRVRSNLVARENMVRKNQDQDTPSSIRQTYLELYRMKIIRKKEHGDVHPESLPVSTR